MSANVIFPDAFQGFIARTNHCNSEQYKRVIVEGEPLPDYGEKRLIDCDAYCDIAEQYLEITGQVNALLCKMHDLNARAIDLLGDR